RVQESLPRTAAALRSLDEHFHGDRFVDPVDGFCGRQVHSRLLIGEAKRTLIKYAPRRRWRKTFSGPARRPARKRRTGASASAAPGAVSAARGRSRRRRRGIVRAAWEKKAKPARSRGRETSDSGRSEV